MITMQSSKSELYTEFLRFSPKVRKVELVEFNAQVKLEHMESQLAYISGICFYAES